MIQYASLSTGHMCKGGTCLVRQFTVSTKVFIAAILILVLYLLLFLSILVTCSKPVTAVRGGVDVCSIPWHGPWLLDTVALPYKVVPGSIRPVPPAGECCDAATLLVPVPAGIVPCTRQAGRQQHRLQESPLDGRPQG